MPEVVTDSARIKINATAMTLPMPPPATSAFLSCSILPRRKTGTVLVANNTYPIN